jgi:hypothetical protein
VLPGTATERQVNSSIAITDITVPLAFTVRGISACPSIPDRSVLRRTLEVSGGVPVRVEK